MPLESSAFDQAVSSAANPLQGMTSMADAYQQALKMRQGALDIQKTYGEQAVGNALQQATDEQGNVDIPKAQRLAAQAGANAAFAMQGFLKTGSQLRGEQINNAAGQYKLTGIAALNVAKDPSDAGVNSAFDNMIASGLPAAQMNAERQRVLAMSSTDRQNYAVQHGLSVLDQLHQVIGQTTGVNTGGQFQPITVTQPGANTPGGLQVGPGAAPTTLTPEGAVGLPNFTYTNPATGRPVVVPGADAIKLFGYGALLPPGAQGHVDLPPGWTQVSGGGGAGGGGGGGGVVGADGKPVSPANPPRLLNVPGQPPAAPAAPGASAASPGAPGGPTIGAAMQAAPAAPAASQLPVPPIPPAAPPPGPRSSLEGGVPVASANPLQAPTVGAAGPPSPLVPGDVNAIMAGMNRARATPAQGTQTAAAFSFGPSAEETQSFKTSADKLAADDLAATEWQSTKLPYVEALKNYGEGTKTGPTTDFWNQVAGTIRTPLAKLGINVGPLSDTTERVDALGKWLASIQSTNPVSAKSDAELAQVLKGSASTHINEVAGEDMVKAGFTLRRMGAALNNDWHNNPALQTQYGTYLRYLGDMNNKIDPRAFSIDMLNDAQKARLRSSLQSGSEADAARFEASLALARRSRQVP